jgi:hypothetical protein
MICEIAGSCEVTRPCPHKEPHNQKEIICTSGHCYYHWRKTEKKVYCIEEDSTDATD